MFTSVKRPTSLIISLILSLTLTACGTIMYPERKGQTGGRIDPGVAVLDGLGLLLFLVPGVVAFAVDFSNGAIYLPSGKRSHLTANDIQALKAGRLSSAKLVDHVTHRVVSNDEVIVQQVSDMKAVERFLSAHQASVSNG